MLSGNRHGYEFTKRYYSIYFKAMEVYNGEVRAVI